MFVGEMSLGVDNFFILFKAVEFIGVYESLMKDYEASELKYVDLKDVVVDVFVGLSVDFKVCKEVLKADKKEIKN